MITLWGYELKDVDGLPPLICPDEFDMYTAKKYSGDIRVPKEMEAASAAIRNYCGWHLFPALPCEIKMTMQDRRVEHNGPDLLIQLPAKFVTAVESVTVDGTEYEFTFETNGLVRVYDVHRQARRAEVVINYTAGLPAEMMAAVRELAAHQSVHSLASSYGITSESAGGVSITYNAAWQNHTRAGALSSSDREVLEPLRCQGVF